MATARAYIVSLLIVDVEAVRGLQAHVLLGRALEKRAQNRGGPTTVALVFLLALLVHRSQLLSLFLGKNVRTTCRC